MDLFSHKIIACELSRTMEEKFVIDSRLRLLSELFFEYIEIFYNIKRIHFHCGFISPNEYEAQFQNKNSAMRYIKAD